MKYDIIIAYRCYPGVSKNPLFWSDDKLAMILKGLTSMNICLGTLRSKFIILDDGCPESFEGLIKKVLHEHDVEYLRTGKIGNSGTYKLQLDLLTTQDDADIVYLAEDDYLYNSSGFEDGIALLRSQKADFVTLFDHRGYYTRHHHSIKSDFHLEKRVWKTVPSTCLTFMTTKKTLQETKNIFILFTKKCWDYPLWLILTKYNLFRFFDIDFSSRIGIIPTSWIHVIMAWVYGWRHILFGKKFTLYAPLPSIATHLEIDDIAPGVDWSKIKSSLEK